MTNCALILIASLPTIWLIVGCLLIVITLIAVVLFLVKAREVATLKKEVMELRDTMRMMRYEELNLSRMLHTADKCATNEEVSDGQSELAASVEDTPAPIEEPSPVIAGEQDETPAVEPTDEPADEAVEDAVEEVAVPAEEAVEEAEENIEETVEAVVEEAIEETEDASEEVAENNTTEELAGDADVEVEEEEPVEDASEEAEEVAEEESEEDLVEEAPEEIPAPVPSGKQSINERRPAIPNDLFSAWFEENEPAEPEVAAPSAEAVEVAAPQQDPISVSGPAEEEAAAPVAASAVHAVGNPEAAPAVETVEANAPSDSEAPAIVLSKEDERFCRKLERIVDTRMRNPNLNIDVIAAQFGIGRTNFYRKVRELMGMSPNDYLRKCRMDRAAELLRTTDLPVSDVCVQIGVPDAQYFSRVFKTFYGVTPTAYREQA